MADEISESLEEPIPFHELDGIIESMQHELAALENSIIHLLQTNAEIREEHDTEDPDLKLALEENTTIIQERTARVQHLKLELSQILPYASNSMAPPVSAPAATSATLSEQVAVSSATADVASTPETRATDASPSVSEEGLIHL